MSNKTNGDNDPSNIEPVHWYDFRQLLNTAKRVAESDTFSRNADRRMTYTDWENNPKAITFKIDDKQETGRIWETTNFYIGANRKKEHANGNWKEEIWVDFVADTGDGGNATYTIAKTLFEDSLNVTNHALLQDNKSMLEKFPDGLPRADLLVLGGDLVYPVANEKDYKERFIDIFKAALPITENDRKKIDNEDKEFDYNQLFRSVVAFPQNHDWYDNLSSFTLLFSNKAKETFLDMKRSQSQSYVAVKLPHDWWLFGLDFALTDDIDEYQFRYFKKIINEKETTEEGITEKSRVIIEYREPIWLTTALGNYGKTALPSRYKELERLIEEKTHRPIDIRLAGDQHHYRRYTSSMESESHLITCGCGGAFLHPTHGPAEFETIHHIRKADDSLRTYVFSTEESCDLTSSETTTYIKKQDYPSNEKSRELSLWNFCFIYKNFWFGLITALSYFLIVWANFSSLFSNIKTAKIKKTNAFEHICYDPTQWKHIDSRLIDNLSLFENVSCAWRLWSWSTILSPLNGIIMILVISGFIFFARKFNSHAKWWATILGFLHGCTHFFAIFIIYYLVLLVTHRDPINNPLEFTHFFKTGAYILILGWPLGATIMGVYLFTTLNLYRRSVAICTLVIVLICSLLMFAMWFNSFLSTLLFFSITVVAVYFLYKIIPSLKIEKLFSHSIKVFSSARVQGYKGFLQSKNTKNCALMIVFISLFLIIAIWSNAFISIVLTVLFVPVAVYGLYKIIPLLKKEILFLHSNEAFSSLRVQDYKGFLRFKITKDRLEAFFIGIDEIPEEWNEEESEKAAVPKWEAKDKEITPQLVDYWTVETPSKPYKRQDDK